ncbi:MAG: hypothetical protein Q4Q58_06025, partial [Thermoplasmata archaeon]|nr:hypothetical protein [Thermoplasmata archaeon]
HHDHDHDDHGHHHHHHTDEFGNVDDHDHDNPVEEGSDLHLEIHRAVDELGKYAIELEIKSEAGIPKEDVKGFIDDIMRTATAECFEHGADLIGHIKSFLKVGEESIMCSMVNPDIPTRVQDNVSSDTVTDAVFVLHVIVHGIWDDVIRDCTLEVLPGVAEKWGIPYTVMADYYDTEKSIAHHEK